MSGVRGVTSALYIVLGAAVIVQTLRYAGARFEAWTGIVLGAAMISLGIIRLRAILAR